MELKGVSKWVWVVVVVIILAALYMLWGRA